MSVADAAQIMQISESTIRRLVADGRINQVGRQVSLAQIAPHAERAQQRHARPRWAELRQVLDLMT